MPGLPRLNMFKYGLKAGGIGGAGGGCATAAAASAKIITVDRASVFMDSPTIESARNAACAPAGLFGLTGYTGQAAFAASTVSETTSGRTVITVSPGYQGYI